MPIETYVDIPHMCPKGARVGLSSLKTSRGFPGLLHPCGLVIVLRLKQGFVFCSNTPCVRPPSDFPFLVHPVKNNSAAKGTVQRVDGVDAAIRDPRGGAVHRPDVFDEPAEDGVAHLAEGVPSARKAHVEAQWLGPKCRKTLSSVIWIDSLEASDLPSTGQQPGFKSQNHQSQAPTTGYLMLDPLN